jgi:cell division topological specificity factor
MGILEFFFPRRDQSATVAKERLQIVLAHERTGRSAPDFLPLLQKDLIEVVGRYVEVDAEMIKVNLGRQGGTSVLEINIEVDGAKVKPRAKPPALSPVAATPSAASSGP